MIKAPPRSGKTATIDIFADDAVKSKAFDKVYTLRADDMRGLKEQMRQMYPEEKRPLSDILLSVGPEKVLVEVDEVQVSYGLNKELGHLELWKNLKILKSGNFDKSNVRVMLFAKYGDKLDTKCSSIPIEFSSLETVDFSSLAFSIRELQDFAEKWNNLHLSSTQPDIKMDRFLKLTPVVVSAIFHMTAGHAGLCRLIIGAIGERYLKSDRYKDSFPVNETDLLAFLLSPEMLATVVKCRAVSTWESVDEAVVRRVLMEGSINQDYNEHLESSFRRLKVSGLMAESGDLLLFSSPLLAMIALRKLFRSEGGGERPAQAYPFNTFVEKALTGMNHATLVNCKAYADLKTYELQQQMEFYRSAVQLLPAKYFAIVNFERYNPVDVTGSENKFALPDFYVGGDLQQSVKLLRDGVGLKESIAEFVDPNSDKYSVGIPVKEQIVINFMEVDVDDPCEGMECEVSNVLERELRVLWSSKCPTHFAALTNGEAKNLSFLKKK